MSTGLQPEDGDPQYRPLPPVCLRRGLKSFQRRNQFFMHAPQYIYLALTFCGLGFAVAKHGEPRDNYHSSLAFVGTVLTLALLYWGGFFV